MQRTAVFVLCAALWTSNASALGCDEIGDVVGGFAGAATGYGLVQSLGSAGSWISAGLYGAGMVVSTLAGNGAAEMVCENFRAILETTALIYCAAGEYMCDFVDDVTRSLVRDFQLCPRCSPDEIFGAFLMDDLSREEYFRRRQTGWASPYLALGTLRRDHVGPLSSSVLNSYFIGMQAGFKQNQSILRSINAY